MMFSVIVPTYNRNLTAALQSLEAQTDKDFEVIIIDDCSTIPILPPKSSSLNIHILRNSENLGPAGSRHEGAKLSSGRFLAFLDDDDEWMPDKLASVRCAIEECGGLVDLIVHRAEICFPNEGVSYLSSNDPVAPLFENSLISNRIGGAPLVTVSRDTYLRSGGFDTNLRADEDYELWLRLIKTNATVKYIDNVLTRCFYVTKQNSVSKGLSNRIAAHKVIGDRYAVDLAKLTWWQRRERHARFYFSLAYSACLLGNSSAYVNLIRSFWYKPSFKTFFVLILCRFGGINSLIKLRSRIGS